MQWNKICVRDWGIADDDDVAYPAQAAADFRKRFSTVSVRFVLKLQTAFVGLPFQGSSFIDIFSMIMYLT